MYIDLYMYIHTYIYIYIYIHMAPFIHIVHIYICIYTCAVTPFFVWHDTSMFVTGQIHVCDVANSHIWHVARASTSDSRVSHGWCGDMSHELCMWVTNYVYEWRSGHRRIQMPVWHYGRCADMSYELCFMCVPTAAAVARESRTMYVSHELGVTCVMCGWC